MRLRRLAVELDAAEPAAVDVRYAIVPRQPLVQKRVVRGDQLGDAAVASQHMFEQPLGFLPHRLPQVVVKIGKEPHVGRERLQISQVEPLTGEVGYERLRPPVGQHPADLPLQFLRLAELAGSRPIEQFVVRDAAP